MPTLSNLLLTLVTPFLSVLNPSGVNELVNDGNAPFDTTLKSDENFGVASEIPACTRFARRILEMDGTAADAAIAALLCVGVARPEAMGIGGGFMLVFYNRTSRTSSMIDAREEAPAASTKDIFNNQQEKARSGPMAIAVPGQIAGLYEVHKRFGGLPWKDLFEGAIELAENGFAVEHKLDAALRVRGNYVLKHKALRDIFADPRTKKLYKLGDIIKQKQLGQTLRELSMARNPRDYFYNDIAKKLLRDIENQADEWDGVKPIITLDDFKNYRPKTNREMVITNFKRGNLQFHTCPLPGSGNLLTFMLKVMEQFDGYKYVGKSLDVTVDFWHRLIETFKFAYAKRMLLGDNAYGFDAVNETVKEIMSDKFFNQVLSKLDMKQTHIPDYYNVSYYQPEDHGTSHVSVLDKFGNAAAVTSTINTYFGSKVLSPSTGIILNNEMDEYSSPGVVNSYGVPPTPFNQIQPGKRPISSTVPSIFVKRNGDVRLVIGGAGGTTITTAVATVTIRHLWLGEDIKKADDALRLHHQLFPNVIFYEHNFDPRVVERLRMKKHKTRLGFRGVVMGVSSDGRGVRTNAK